jgi:unsaturated chondroitin disaccharide hydrolase
MKSIAYEPIKKEEKILTDTGFCREDCEKAISFVLKKIDQNLDTFTYQFPAPASIKNDDFSVVFYEKGWFVVI